MIFNKNTVALIYTGLLALSFFLAGIFNVLDYFIVKAILFIAFTFLGAILVWIALKDSDQKKSP
ncbi:hypothetical protein [uncultured Psychroserpens sp.]|uniref:hypothetical protein n=1 Tax=uncultured Psychroserpens sp. TaxID=255436 RepID=UPI002631CEEC|nr:hypothetical protein [uncultured Psychroserpens sp.]